ncbi:hypothetical protein OG21DRAFT_1471674 [Imleria badia]|nr:hypothetical protein OG21DRAFT_1471674 [Imleria badia]
MIHPLIIFLYLARVVQGTSTDTTSHSCPPPDGTTRSLWSILGSCALTLLICVWQAIHPPVPPHRKKWPMGQTLLLTIASFLLPEMTVYTAVSQWWKARRIVKEFDRGGYAWSMSHSFFAEMGGFVYRDDDGREHTIRSLEFLDLCKENKIANPVITVREIKDKSKSDVLGKAILAIQLFWFTLQVAVRHFTGLAVTLVELDTVCMAVLTLCLLLFWRDKPLRPECPHIFYSHLSPQADRNLKETWKPEPCFLKQLMAYTRKTQTITDEEKIPPVGLLDSRAQSNVLQVIVNNFLDFPLVSLFATWFIFGGLHLTAWKFPFVTEAEQRTWHIASLILTGAPLALIVVMGLLFTLISVGWCPDKQGRFFFAVFLLLGLIVAEISRIALVAVMFTSFRSVPCSAYQVVSWTTYIPHL